MYLVWVVWKVSPARCSPPLSSLPRCHWPPSSSWQPRSSHRPPGKKKRTPKLRCAAPGGGPEPSYTSLTWGLHEHTHTRSSWQLLSTRVIGGSFRRDVLLLLGLHPSRWYWPAAVAEDEEEHTEDDAGDSNVNADYDARSGGLVLFIFHTVARGVQHWEHTDNLICKTGKQILSSWSL